jgi:hypothetical protein
MSAKFSKINETGATWSVETEKKTFGVKEIAWNDPDLTGLRDPDDPSKMNTVNRPIESK